MKYLWIGPMREVPKVGKCETDKTIIDDEVTRLTYFEINDLIRQGFLTTMDLNIQNAEDNQHGSGED